MLMERGPGRAGGASIKTLPPGRPRRRRGLQWRPTRCRGSRSSNNWRMATGLGLTAAGVLACATPPASDTVQRLPMRRRRQPFQP